MEAFQFNLKSQFRYQNKFFFEKAFALLNQYKKENDLIHFDEKIDGTGFVSIEKEKKKFIIYVICENNKWSVKICYNNNFSIFDFNYLDDDYTIIQIHKELLVFLSGGSKYGIL